MDIGIDMPFDHGTELLVAVVLVRRVVLPRQDVVLGRDLYPLFGTAAALAHCLRCFETIDANFFFPFVLGKTKAKQKQKFSLLFLFCFFL